MFDLWEETATIFGGQFIVFALAIVFSGMRADEAMLMSAGMPFVWLFVHFARGNTLGVCASLAALFATLALGATIAISSADIALARDEVLAKGIATALCAFSIFFVVVAARIAMRLDEYQWSLGKQPSRWKYYLVGVPLFVGTLFGWPFAYTQRRRQEILGSHIFE